MIDAVQADAAPRLADAFAEDNRQLEVIIGAIEEEIPGSQLFIAHRYGELTIGDISIVIASASAHRDEAYRASREAIERIKVDVPIFKKELTTDGDTWVGWGGG